MSPQSGIRLGPYEVTAQIGQGGMGEVHGMRDTRYIPKNRRRYVWLLIL